MANLPETPDFDAGIYQIEQTDPVLGGAPNPATGAGLVNIPHLQLARRTQYLKQQLDAIEAELAQYPLDGLAPRQSPAFSGNPTAPTPPQDTNSTRLATTAFVLGQAGSAAPLAAGTAAPGTSPRFARQDHRHPTDTTRAPVASPALTGTPTAPTPAPDTNNQQIATTAFVLGQAGSAAPLAAGTAAPGTSPRYARQDHRHPTDTTRAPVGRAISAGAGLTGGGDLTADRTLSLGTPGTITGATTNAASGASHTHQLDLGALPLASDVSNDLNPRLIYLDANNNVLSRIQPEQLRQAFGLAGTGQFNNALGAAGWQALPGGLIMQWGGGAYDASAGATGTVITLPIAFPNAFFRVVANDVASGVNTVAATANGLNGLRVWARTPGGVFASTVINWFAFGR